MNCLILEIDLNISIPFLVLTAKKSSFGLTPMHQTGPEVAANFAYGNAVKFILKTRAVNVFVFKVNSKKQSKSKA
jgi:hypothetical protein